MSEAYTTVKCTGQTGSSNTSTEVTDQLVADINQLYKTMYEIGLSEDELDDLIEIMMQDSNSSNTNSWTANTMLDMIEVLIQDTTCVYGALAFMAGLMNVTSDLTNEVTAAQDSFLNMCNNVVIDDQGTAKAASGYDPTEDEETFNDAISVFNETEFTIYYADGSSTETDGVIDLLSNGEYWSGSADSKAPMGASSAQALTESIETIEGMFGNDWGNSSTYFSYVCEWSESEPGTSTSDNADAIETTQPEISDMNNLMGQMDAQLETNYTTEGNYMNYGMTMVQQMQSATEEAIQTAISENMYIVQHSA